MALNKRFYCTMLFRTFPFSSHCWCFPNQKNESYDLARSLQDAQDHCQNTKVCIHIIFCDVLDSHKIWSVTRQHQARWGSSLRTFPVTLDITRPRRSIWVVRETRGSRGFCWEDETKNANCKAQAFILLLPLSLLYVQRCVSQQELAGMIKLTPPRSN